MTPEERDDFVIAIMRAMQQARSVSDSEHYDHHRWIKAQIEAEQSRQKFWDEMRAHVVKWGVIGALTGLAGAAILGAKAWLKQ